MAVQYCVVVRGLASVTRCLALGQSVPPLAEAIRQQSKEKEMQHEAGIRKLVLAALAVWTFLAGGSAIANAQAAGSKPNILFIMGDDIGWMQVGLYHRGLALGETPNIDRIGQEGAVFTDYYAMQ